MRSDEDRISPSEGGLAPLLVNGESIPLVDKYVYLGVEINKDLDFKTMAKYRITKGQGTLACVRNTLCNNRVPLEYKPMLIRSVLIPRLTFGAEIFGMSKPRTQAMKAILDNSIKCVLGSSKFCRLRAYEELSIEPLHISTSVARTRAFRKWFDSRSLIRDLLVSMGEFKCKKRTWTTQTKVWLKYLRIDLELETRELIHEVRLNRMVAWRAQDRSVIGSRAVDLSLGSGRQIRFTEIHGVLPHRGIIALTRIRTGTFRFADYYARIGAIEPIYREQCFCCRAIVREDAWHLLMECTAFSTTRAQFPFGRGLTVVRDGRGFVLGLATLLGGEQVASQNKLPRETVDVIVYLSLVIPRRSAFLAGCLGPARV